ncbi:MAG: ADP-ribose diphosphatase [Aliivibrio sp.]|uniref:ADP-ribose diphosphatase n=1 Tax=Aliivibrio sp. TaxID=1872443 RepID=UPI001A414FCE|nr:ADP-ribose diphosphatase [Aliivibrio sp.]
MTEKNGIANKSETFNKQDVEVMSKTSLFNGFFSMVKYTFRHRLFAGGWSDTIEREMFERGHAAALLPYDPILDKVVLIEQIRVGALEDRSPWQFEIIAGMIDKGESAEEVVRRESMEEAGLTVISTEKITCYFPSSGACSERLDLFVGLIDSRQAGGIHGLEEEGEDIKVHIVDRELAYSMVNSGKIENSASIIALQWLELNNSRLRSLHSNDE